MVSTQSCSSSALTSAMESSGLTPGSGVRNRRKGVSYPAFHYSRGVSGGVKMFQGKFYNAGGSGLLWAAALLLSAVFGCATNPATGEHQISFVSQSQEVRMGQEADPAIIQEYGLYDDRNLQHYIDSVGQKLASVSHLPKL